MKGKKMDQEPMVMHDGQFVSPEEMVSFWTSIAEARKAAVPSQSPKTPGRKKQLGTLDSSSGRIMYFVGYCPEGHKTLLTRDELDSLAKRAHKEQRRPMYRLFKWWSRHL